MARGPPRRRSTGPGCRCWGPPTRRARRPSTSIASAARTPIPSTGPRTRRRSCCARTSRRPARSSRTTGRGRSSCLGFASQLVFDTFTSSHVLRHRARRRPGVRDRGRARPAPGDARCGARSTRACCPCASSRSATWRPRSRSTREAIDGGAAALQIGQYCPPGHSPSHVELEPVWAMAAEAGVPIVLHVAGAGAQRDEPAVLRERPAAGARLPRRRRQLQVDRLPVDPAAGDADAERARDRRCAATPSAICASA